ncbi:MAG: hypothetical protein QT00_C0002G0236 [archaeon GW2011_AR5]|nr:MAG: hypothetical protein QT00_C0002G0236 [archaeon GW2011_AR5]
MRFSKGQQEALSAVLISGILIGVVGSVYFWGVPLIQKNKDISLLETSEAFMRQLDEKIRSVANNGGRDQIIIPVPGIVSFENVGTELDPQMEIKLTIETEGTIYATDAEIPLGRNTLSTLEQSGGEFYGTWGIDDPVLFNVKSVKLRENNYRNEYTLTYIQLKNDNSLRDFKIGLTGSGAAGGQDKTIIMENRGDVTTPVLGRTLVTSNVEISII